MFINFMANFTSLLIVGSKEIKAKSAYYFSYFFRQGQFIFVVTLKHTLTLLFKENGWQLAADVYTVKMYIC